MNYSEGSNWLAYSEDRLRKLVEEIARAHRVIVMIARTSQSVPVKAGFIAEEMHSLTFNLDAIMKGAIAEACTDRHESFYDFEFQKNGPSDLVVANEYITLLAQVKFYSTPQGTAAALRELRAGVHVYANMLLVAPTDQIIGVSDAARKTMLRERAKARRLEVANAAEYVMNTVSDVIDLGGVVSKPIALKEAHDIAMWPCGLTFYSFVEPFIYDVVFDIMRQRHHIGAPHGISPFLNDYDMLRQSGFDAEYIDALHRTRMHVAHCAATIPPIPNIPFYQADNEPVPW
ncbi:hypothetical protein [Azospirillum baldaniorum]|uniref:hypothetical protein n=1 Tax=Azospirillum baldaniorum TaxID=1064539 RepID=UPI001013D56A|nr:hypothetical protein [Azospirillum baldaniorum]